MINDDLRLMYFLSTAQTTLVEYIASEIGSEESIRCINKLSYAINSAKLELDSMAEENKLANQ